MNELEELRAMFVGIRAQADAGIRAVTTLIAAMENEEEEEREPPRTFGGKPIPPENKSDG